MPDHPLIATIGISDVGRASLASFGTLLEPGYWGPSFDGEEVPAFSIHDDFKHAELFVIRLDAPKGQDPLDDLRAQNFEQVNQIVHQCVRQGGLLIAMVESAHSVYIYRNGQRDGAQRNSWWPLCSLGIVGQEALSMHSKSIELVDGLRADYPRLASAIKQMNPVWCVDDRKKFPDFMNVEVLATNQNNDYVAIAVLPNEERKLLGTQYAFPIPQDEERFLDSCMELVSARHPELFSVGQSLTWTKGSPVEPEAALALREELDTKRSQFEAEQDRLLSEIEVVREAHSWEIELLTATGDALVNAVVKGLHAAGLHSARAMDEVNRNSLAEDINLEEPTVGRLLLVEVKGLSGLPSEEEANTAPKYLAHRMKQDGRTDVDALTIVNYQRGLPPAARSPNPYTPRVLAQVESEDAIMTSGDLLYVLRSAIALDWPTALIARHLHSPGWRRQAPPDLLKIGEVEKRLPDVNVLGVYEVAEEVAIAQTLLVEGPQRWHQVTIAGIEIERKQMDLVPARQQKVAIKLSDGDFLPREGSAIWVLQVP